MFPITLPTSPETVAFLQAETDEESEYQQDIQQARDYDDGRQSVALTDRLRQFLGGSTATTTEDWKRLRLNICRIILAAVVDRLIVANFDTDEVPQAQATIDDQGQPTTKLIKRAASWAWLTWQRNRMDAKQRRVHESALRDSESFVIVDWDNEAKRARFTPHLRFVDVSTTAHADVGEGCRAFYRNDDPDQDLLFVTKRWTEITHTEGGTRITKQRLTVYLPGEIRKYIGFPGAWRHMWDGSVTARQGGGWEARVDGTLISLETFTTQDAAWAYVAHRIERNDLPWPILWADKKGMPLGIPVAHFRSSAGMEAKEAWPIQNAINKAFVDLMTESDMAAFRILIAFGWKPVDSAGNPITFAPGQIIGTEKAGATAQVVPGGDLSQFLNLIESLVLWAAQVTDTPVSRFITTKQVSSEGSQKEQGGALLTKTRNRQGELGNGWEHAMFIALRLENTFGQGGLDEAAFLQTQWEPLEARDESAELDMALKRQSLGMPVSLIAQALGLSPEQVALWVEDAAQKSAQAAQQFSQQAAQQPPMN